jgi:hypothetical protein
MTAVAIPSRCDMALKEWATVLQALSCGEQLVLIRKGGLIEPGGGFELLANAFLFYPTFEHQAVNYLRPPYQHYFQDAVTRRAPEGHVRVDLVGVAVTSEESREPGIVDRLRAFHIYNDVFVNQRLKWQPEQPLVIVIVRAFRLEGPLFLPVVPRYAGCRSWVELESPVQLEGLVPVLNDRTFQQRVREVTALL